MVNSWIIFALLSAIVTSAFQIVEKKTLRDQHAMEFTSILGIFAMLITIPFFFIADVSSLTITQIYFIYGASLFCSIGDT